MLARIMIIFILLSPVHAHAQQTVAPCIPVTTNGVTVCTPISSTNPLPTQSQ